MEFFHDLPASFTDCLRQNPEAAQFYGSCTPMQKQAILNQLSAIESEQNMKAFVDHLPNAAL